METNAMAEQNMSNTNVAQAEEAAALGNISKAQAIQLAAHFAIEYHQAGDLI
jgi:hypothetical protein